MLKEYFDDFRVDLIAWSQLLSTPAGAVRRPSIQRHRLLKVLLGAFFFFVHHSKSLRSGLLRVLKGNESLRSGLLRVLLNRAPYIGYLSFFHKFTKKLNRPKLTQKQGYLRTIFFLLN